MKIAIVDDEKKYRDEIERIVTKYNKSFEIVKFESGEEFLNSNIKSYDIVFLDIEMGDINGVETGTIAISRGASFLIFYVTSHSGYISKALHNQPFQYLMKPISEENLLYELKRGIQKISSRNKKLYLNFRGESAVVLVKNIMHIELKDRKLFYYTKENKEYVSGGKIESIEKELDKYGFITVHKSYVVNMHYIEEISANEIILFNKEVIPMSRSKRQEVKIKFNTFVEKEFV